jgi:hypothetical protein
MRIEALHATLFDGQRSSVATLFDVEEHLVRKSKRRPAPIRPEIDPALDDDIPF